MSEKPNLKELILNDPDFINSPKYNNSLEKFMERHDDGVEDSHAAKVLMIDDKEFERLHKEAVENLKDIMGADND